VIRVLLADDQALVRSGFGMILQAREDLEVAGEAEDGAEAVALARSLQPDVILMDVRMPKLDGIEATRRIVASGSAARVLILTTYDLDEYVYAAIRAGASGFLLKDVEPAQLVDAVRVVARGDALLAPTVTRRLLERFADALPGAPTVPAELVSLTRREREILELVATGLSNAEIAERLVLGETTVKSHVSSVLRKLGLRDRVQAVVLAYQAGLVQRSHVYSGPVRGLTPDTPGGDMSAWLKAVTEVRQKCKAFRTPAPGRARAFPLPAPNLARGHASICHACSGRARGQTPARARNDVAVRDARGRRGRASRRRRPCRCR
jgi:DNA-binding NarL/FixJ family response regulator